MHESNRTFHDKSQERQIRHKTRHKVLTDIVADTFTYTVCRGTDEQQIDAAMELNRADLIDPET